MSFDLCHLGINKINNTIPVAVSVNNSSSSIATNGGSLYQSGLLDGEVRAAFQDAGLNENVLGRIVEVQSTDDRHYLLNHEGSVFELDRHERHHLREVYAAHGCNERAVKIASGNGHLLILTCSGNVYGLGNNHEYQLVPQGQCKYNCATQLLVADTNVHDNCCPNYFSGTLSELESPVIDGDVKCGKPICINKPEGEVQLGFLEITSVTVGSAGTLKVPVCAVLSYVGFLCADECMNVKGNVTYSIKKVFIKCGCQMGLFDMNAVKLASTSELVLFEADEETAPLSSTVLVEGKCNQTALVTLDLSQLIAELEVVLQGSSLSLTLEQMNTLISTVCGTPISAYEAVSLVLNARLNILLNCCQTELDCSSKLKQPKWTDIYAGCDISVLVDNCNRLFVLGSLHRARNNAHHLKDNCLSKLLQNNDATLVFPANQLNCSPKSESCCNTCTSHEASKSFHTDLSKFDIKLSLNNNGCSTPCEFLADLKRCNDNGLCAQSCEPCDEYIYLDVKGECPNLCGRSSSPVGSVVLYNHKSVCKAVSQGKQEIINVNVDVESVVDFNEMNYCINNTTLCLDKIVRLVFCEGPEVKLYLGSTCTGGIKFNGCETKKCNIEFPIDKNTETRQLLLNYGSVIDPVELANLKHVLGLNCYFACSSYKNPFDSKIFSTYLKGGDSVKFIANCGPRLAHAITPDVPTVFRLNRKVSNVGVGDNNLTVVSNNSCGSEVSVLGNNCSGELGQGSVQSTLVWKQINRCYFNNDHVVAVFSGKGINFFLTESNHVYSSGRWNCQLNDLIPNLLKRVRPEWKVRDISVAPHNLLMLGGNGSVYGLGSNGLGELGLRLGTVACNPTLLHLQNGCHQRKSACHSPKKQQPKCRRPDNGCGTKQKKTYVSGGGCNDGCCGSSSEQHHYEYDSHCRKTLDYHPSMLGRSCYNPNARLTMHH